MIKRISKRIYIGLIILFMYAPIMVLIILSFNSSRSRVVWEGFTFKWYGTLFKSTAIMDALKTTVALAFLSALTATVIGLLAATGIYAMRVRDQKIIIQFSNFRQL